MSKDKIDPGYTVLSTRSGFYVGRTYELDGIKGFPYSRNSIYFATRLEAENHLKKINDGLVLPVK